MDFVYWLRDGLYLLLYYVELALWKIQLLLNTHPFLTMLVGSVSVLLLLLDWDWKRNVYSRYALWRWSRKRAALMRLKRALGEE